MIIKNQLRPTMIRTNSRFRGPTEIVKFTNFVQEAAHDIKLLANVMDGNDFLKKDGHTDFIYNNFAKLVNGTDEGIHANSPSVATLCRPTDNVFKNLNLLSSDWIAYGSCVRTGANDIYQLESPGLLDPSGISTELMVDAGQVIYIRMAVRLLEGDTTSFSLGSDNITNGTEKGDIKRFILPQNGSTIYVDKRLYCQHRESINLNIDVHRLPHNLQAAKVEVSNVEIRYMTENNVLLQPSNGVLKPRVDLLHDKIDSIVTNM